MYTSLQAQNTMSALYLLSEGHSANQLFLLFWGAMWEVVINQEALLIGFTPFILYIIG